MNCTNCGAPVSPGDQQCPSCGAWLGNSAQSYNQQVYQQSYQQQPYQQPAVNNFYINGDNLPSQYRPLGAWEYFGYMLLYSIPIVGFILLIVFSFSDSNINRRNFTRSYWCGLAIALVIFIILFATGLLTFSTYSRYY